MVDSEIRGLPVISAASRAFSLVEMLVALAIFALILLIVTQVVGETERAWKHSSANIQAFQNARVGFDAMYRAISEATLNTYYDYYESPSLAGTSTFTPMTSANTATFIPSVYGRYSELHFISGKTLVSTPRAQVTHSVFFQAPLSYTATSASYGNMTSLLNGVGFYIDFNSDQGNWPTFFPSLSTQPAPRWRYRLMEFMQPTEQLTVYTGNSGTAWFTAPLVSTSPPVVVLAENIIACVICPHLPGEMTPTSPGTSLTSNYEYDSRAASSPWTSGTQPTSMNQLPPLVRLVLIAADEGSMIQIQGSSTTQPSLGFTTSGPAAVFQNPAYLTTDLATVSAALTAHRINYRIFQTDVPIRSASWSQ